TSGSGAGPVMRSESHSESKRNCSRVSTSSAKGSASRALLVPSPKPMRTFTSRARSKGHRQRRQSPQHDVLLVLELLARKGEVVDAGRDRCQRHLSLDPRQRCAQTEVSAQAERQMAVFLAADVEGVGVGELLGVTVGGGDQ